MPQFAITRTTAKGRWISTKRIKESNQSAAKATFDKAVSDRRAREASHPNYERIAFELVVFDVIWTDK